MSATPSSDGGRSQEETAVDHAQTLVAHLDSSADDLNALREALAALEDTAILNDFTLAIARDHLEAADDCLDHAWDILEDGDDPLLAEDTVVSHDDHHSFVEGVPAADRLRDISEDAGDAADYLGAVHSSLTMDATPAIDTDALAGDFGVYETLAEYVEYLSSECHTIRARAEVARSLC